MIVLEQFITRRKKPFTLSDLADQIQDQTTKVDRETCSVMVEICHHRASESVSTFGVIESVSEIMGSRLVFPTSRFNPTSKEREEVTMAAVSFIVPARKVEPPLRNAPKGITVSELLKAIKRTEENCQRWGEEPVLRFKMPVVADIRSLDGTSKSWFITRVEYDEDMQAVFLCCDLLDSARTDAYRILKDFESECVSFVDDKLNK